HLLFFQVLLRRPYLTGSLGFDLPRSLLRRCFGEIPVRSPSFRPFFGKVFFTGENFLSALLFSKLLSITIPYSLWHMSHIAPKNDVKKSGDVIYNGPLDPGPVTPTRTGKLNGHAKNFRGGQTNGSQLRPSCAAHAAEPINGFQPYFVAQIEIFRF